MTENRKSIRCIKSTSIRNCHEIYINIKEALKKIDEMFIFTDSVANTVTEKKIKALTVRVCRLSLSEGWENDAEQGLQTVSFNP